MERLDVIKRKRALVVGGSLLLVIVAVVAFIFLRTNSPGAPSVHDNAGPIQTPNSLRFKDMIGLSVQQVHKKVNYPANGNARNFEFREISLDSTVKSQPASNRVIVAVCGNDLRGEPSPVWLGVISIESITPELQARLSLRQPTQFDRALRTATPECQDLAQSVGY